MKFSYILNTVKGSMSLLLAEHPKQAEQLTQENATPGSSQAEPTVPTLEEKVAALLVTAAQLSPEELVQQLTAIQAARTMAAGTRAVDGVESQMWQTRRELQDLHVLLRAWLQNLVVPPTAGV